MSTLAENNAVQLWRKAELHTRNALNLMHSDVADISDLGDVIEKVEKELRQAREAMAQLHLRAQHEARLSEPEVHHPKCGCAQCQK